MDTDETQIKMKKPGDYGAQPEHDESIKAPTTPHVVAYKEFVFHLSPSVASTESLRLLFPI